MGRRESAWILRPAQDDARGNGTFIVHFPRFPQGPSDALDQVISRMSANPLPTPSRFARTWETAGMLLVLAVLFIGCSVFVDNFLTVTNLRGLALAVATIGMVSC